jgi:hypothetical protein
MGKWSGRGSPPTRKKLHRVRQELVRERKTSATDQRAEQSRRDYTWSKLTRKAITNPARFEEMWGE